MPNWVKNIVTMPESTMNKIKEKYFTNGIFDFDKVIPMPKTLDLTEGAITEIAIYYAFLQKNKEKRSEIINILSGKKSAICDNYWEKIKFYKDNGNFKDIYYYAKRYVPGESAKELNIRSLEELGDTYIDNIKKYGSPTWYDWCSENWGTKWKAADFSSDKTTMIFHTAWSIPEPIFQKLSKEFPDDLIEVKYADECYANYNNGILKFKDGLKDIKDGLDENFAKNVWDEKESKDIVDELFD